MEYSSRPYLTQYLSGPIKAGALENNLGGTPDPAGLDRCRYKRHWLTPLFLPGSTAHPPAGQLRGEAVRKSQGIAGLLNRL